MQSKADCDPINVAKAWAQPCPSERRSAYNLCHPISDVSALISSSPTYKCQRTTFLSFIMTANTTQATNAWDLARSRFLEEKKEFLRDLSPIERRLYEDASMETILNEANESHQRFNQTDTLNRLRQKLKPLVNALDGYGKGLDVISNVSTVSAIMAPLWGSVRVVLYVCLSYLSFK